MTSLKHLLCNTEVHFTCYKWEGDVFIHSPYLDHAVVENRMLELRGIVRRVVVHVGSQHEEHHMSLVEELVEAPAEHLEAARVYVENFVHLM